MILVDHAELGCSGSSVVTVYSAWDFKFDAGTETIESQLYFIWGGSVAAETEEVFWIAGLMEVPTEEGATFFDHNHPPFVSVDLDGFYHPLIGAL